MTIHKDVASDVLQDFLILVFFIIARRSSLFPLLSRFLYLSSLHPLPTHAICSFPFLLICFASSPFGLIHPFLHHPSLLFIHSLSTRVTPFYSQPLFIHPFAFNLHPFSAILLSLCPHNTATHHVPCISYLSSSYNSLSTLLCFFPYTLASCPSYASFILPPSIKRASCLSSLILFHLCIDFSLFFPFLNATYSSL